MGKCKDFYESARKNYDATQALAHRVLAKWEATEVRSLTKDECAAAFIGFGIGLINGSDFVMNGLVDVDDDEIREWMLSRVTSRKLVGMIDAELDDILTHLASGKDTDEDDVELMPLEDLLAIIAGLVSASEESGDE